jgi:hypothetical protein
MPTDENENLRTAYRELSTSYRAIDDFRAKLLGFLPLATGTGMFLVLGNVKDITPPKDGATTELWPAIGIFGFLITLGLFLYEIYGIKKCDALIQAGGEMESSMGITNGQFCRRPQNVAFVINEPFASGIIYPAVLAAWAFFYLYFAAPAANRIIIPIFVFLIGLAGTSIYDWLLRKRVGQSGLCERPGVPKQLSQTLGSTSAFEVQTYLAELPEYAVARSATGEIGVTWNRDPIARPLGFPHTCGHQQWFILPAPLAQMILSDPTLFEGQ